MLFITVSTPTIFYFVNHPARPNDSQTKFSSYTLLRPGYFKPSKPASCWRRSSVLVREVGYHSLLSLSEICCGKLR